MRKKLKKITTLFGIKYDVTITHTQNYLYEIILKYNGRTYHDYFNIIDNDLDLSTKKWTSLSCADLCILQFFERHIPDKTEVICKYRKRFYKWNVGRLAYLPIKQANITMPNSVESSYVGQ